MLRQIIAATTGLALGLLIAGCSGDPKPGTPEYTRAKIQQSIDSIAVNPQSSFNDTLAKLPEEPVSISLLAAMDSRQDLADDSRLAVYEQLRRHNASNLPAGVQKLLLGLRDTLPVAMTSLQALKTTQEPNRPTVIRGMDTLLMDTTLGDGVRMDMISMLMVWQALDSSHIDRLTSIYRDTTCSAPLRKSAYAGLLEPAGATYCLNLLNMPDPAGLSAALQALAGTVGLTIGTTGTEADLKRMKQLCLQSLFHKEKEVRVAALAALQGIYGKDYQSKVDNRWEVNPEIMRALERMGQTDPDSTLRAQIAHDVIMLKK
jgi:hypothetical protein